MQIVTQYDRMSNAKGNAGVAELADAHDSKSCGAIRAGSSPATGIQTHITTSDMSFFTL